MTTDYRALCAELVAALDPKVVGLDGYGPIAALLPRARAALAEPEPDHFVDVPEMVEPNDGEVATLVGCLHDLARADWLSDETADILTRAADLLERLAPQPQPEGPSDAELLELMPQQFRDDLATVSRLAAHGTSPDVTPGIFRVSLNTGALDYARAVLARWGE